MNELTAEGSAYVSCPSGHNHGYIPIRAVFDEEKPYRIRLQAKFSSGPWEWEIERELARRAASMSSIIAQYSLALLKGVSADYPIIGEGNITFKTKNSSADLITLRAPITEDGVKDFTYIVVSRAALQEFLRKTYVMIPRHAETAVLNLDAVESVLEGWKK